MEDHLHRDPRAAYAATATEQRRPPDVQACDAQGVCSTLLADIIWRAGGKRGRRRAAGRGGGGGRPRRPRSHPSPSPTWTAGRRRVAARERKTHRLTEPALPLAAIRAIQRFFYNNLFSQTTIRMALHNNNNNNNNNNFPITFLITQARFRGPLP